MRKRFTILPICLAVAMLAGCSNSTTVETTAPEQSFENEAATVEATEQSQEDLENETSETGTETFISTGVLINYSSEPVDNFGNTEATFQDADGNEFVAIISEDTVVPETFEAGVTYDVTHSEIQTMNIPPQYPEVSEIALSDEVIEAVETEAGIEGEAPSESTEVPETENVSEEVVEVNELTDEELASLEAAE